jgi:universal stress protein E
MQRIMIVADRRDRQPFALNRGLALARRSGAEVLVVTFAYEYFRNLPVEVARDDIKRGRDRLIAELGRWLERTIRASSPGSLQVEHRVVWEKDPARWVNDHVRGLGCTLVVKTGRRVRKWLYTPTDWRLIRGCPVPLLLVAGRHWRRGRHVLAAVDLGTKVASKRALNLRVARAADALAKLLECQLHLAYVPPCPAILRDLGAIDADSLTRASRHVADAFAKSLAREGVRADAVHVRAGPTERGLVSIAAGNRIDVTVIGTVGRRGLVGTLVGNTAERVLSLIRTDVLVIK